MKKNYINWFIIIILGIIIFSVISIFNEKKGSTTNNEIIKDEEILDNKDKNEDLQIEKNLEKVIIKSINKEISTITFYLSETNEIITLNYDEYIMIKNKFGKFVDVDSLQIGEIVDVSYFTDDYSISELNKTDCLEFKNLSNIEIEQKNIKIDDDLYKISKNTIVIDNGELISIDEIKKTDLFTIRIIGSDIYSIVRTKSHGYLTFTNANYFYGGKLYIDNLTEYDFNKNLRLTLREGSYEIKLKKGDDEYIEKISILKNKEECLDLSDYKKKVKYSKVSIYVDPKNADIIIDGIEVVGNTFDLKYGTYDVKIMSIGYKSYNKKMVVNKPKMKFNIILDKEESFESPIDDSNKNNGKSKVNVQNKNLSTVVSNNKLPVKNNSNKDNNINTTSSKNSGKETDLIGNKGIKEEVTPMFDEPIFGDTDIDETPAPKGGYG